MSSLSELLLSSTSSTSPLPTTQLHSLLTGSLLFSFKSPNASNSTAAEQDPSSSLGYRKTMGYAETANGCGGVVMGMGGKEGRAGINVWGFQKVRRLWRERGVDGELTALLPFAGASSAEADPSCAALDHVPVQHRNVLGRWNLGRSHFLLGGA